MNKKQKQKHTPLSQKKAAKAVAAGMPRPMLKKVTQAEFSKLQAEWDLKLKQSGFDDIETAKSRVRNLEVERTPYTDLAYRFDILRLWKQNGESLLPYEHIERLEAFYAYCKEHNRHLLGLEELTNTATFGKVTGLGQLKMHYKLKIRFFKIAIKQLINGKFVSAIVREYKAAEATMLPILNKRLNRRWKPIGNNNLRLLVKHLLCYVEHWNKTDPQGVDVIRAEENRQFDEMVRTYGHVGKLKLSDF